MTRATVICLVGYDATALMIYAHNPTLHTFVLALLGAVVVGMRCAWMDADAR